MTARSALCAQAFLSAQRGSSTCAQRFHSAFGGMQTQATHVDPQLAIIPAHQLLDDRWRAGAVEKVRPDCPENRLTTGKWCTHPEQTTGT